MPTDMTAEEFELEQASASGGTDVSFQDDEDSDKYVTATAYTNANGRAWRHIESSGFNSCYDGAGDFGEWLADDEDPADFGQDN